MNEEKILQEEEKLYEKLLLKIEDRSSYDYKRIYRKLYYIRNRAEIKQYQKTYYKKRKETRTEYAPPLSGKNSESFKIRHEPITIVFE
tara:strand:+ start:611 stop:874 length:264 start_codon:yes stop_codon:yes gene_type:complete